MRRRVFRKFTMRSYFIPKHIENIRCGVFILCRSAKNEPRKRAKGHCPLDSRYERLQAETFGFQGGAQRVCLTKSLHLGRISARPRWACRMGFIRSHGGKDRKEIFCVRTKKKHRTFSQTHLADRRRQDGGNIDCFTFERRLSPPWRRDSDCELRGCKGYSTPCLVFLVRSLASAKE